MNCELSEKGRMSLIFKAGHRSTLSTLLAAFLIAAMTPIQPQVNASPMTMPPQIAPNASPTVSKAIVPGEDIIHRITDGLTPALVSSLKNAANTCQAKTTSARLANLPAQTSSGRSWSWWWWLVIVIIILIGLFAWPWQWWKKRRKPRPPQS
jgi:hypothetical protein